MRLLALSMILVCAGCASSNTHRFVVVDNSFRTSEEWDKNDGTICGTVNKWKDRSYYEAYAYDEFSKVHKFSTLTEAEAFITQNWCKP